jgi:hypothetical protein
MSATVPSHTWLFKAQYYLPPCFSAPSPVFHFGSSGVFLCGSKQMHSVLTLGTILIKVYLRTDFPGAGWYSQKWRVEVHLNKARIQSHYKKEFVLISLVWLCSPLGRMRYSGTRRAFMWSCECRATQLALGQREEDLGCECGPRYQPATQCRMFKWSESTAQHIQEVSHTFLQAPALGQSLRESFS